MTYPSHAGSSVNEVANAYMGNPQALQQRVQQGNGITPELVDMLAQQLLNSKLEAAKNEMAISNGQNQPTVKQMQQDSAMQSARQEIAQKLGLPGLMNQGQAVPQPAGGQQGPQGAPQGGPPQSPQQPQQAPTVNAAQGGLMRIPSNLPASYAGGGIIAFDGRNGSVVPETYVDSYTGEEVTLPKNEDKSAPFWKTLIKPEAEAYEKPRETQADVDLQNKIISPSSTKETTANYVPRNTTIQSLINALVGVESGGDTEAVSKQGARGSMQIMPGTFKDYAKPGESYDNDTDRRAAATRKIMADYKYYGGDTDKVLAAYIGGRGAVLADGTIRDDIKDAEGTTPAAYVAKVNARMGSVQPSRTAKDNSIGVANDVSAEYKPKSEDAGLAGLAKQDPLREAITKRTISTLERTPEDAMKSEVDLRESMTGQSTRDAIESMKRMIAKREDLQAKEQANRPDKFLGIFNRAGLAALDPSSSTPWKNVSNAVEAERLGYAKQDAGYQTDIETLNKAMYDAIASNDIGKYNAAVKAKVDLENRQDKASTTGENMLSHDATNARLREDKAARLEQVRQHDIRLAGENVEKVRQAQEKIQETAAKNAQASLQDNEEYRMAKLGILPYTQSKTPLNDKQKAELAQLRSKIALIENKALIAAGGKPVNGSVDQVPTGTTKTTKSGITYTVS